jgi:hypothetical protein
VNGARAETSGALWLWAAALCAFFYYWTLLSDGKFLAAEPVRYGLTFNSMIEYLARGRFDVDPDVILHEGFARDGRTYAYFGPVPALLRLPILLWPRFRDVDFTILSCAVGATLGAMAKLAAVLRAGRAMRATPWRGRILLFAFAAVVFGGEQTQFARPSIFQESLYWAGAIAALFVLLVFRWCVDPDGRKPRHLVVMAVVAGVCLLTRVSTSIGLYAACGGIMLAELVGAIRSGEGPFVSRAFRVIARTILLPSLILIMFVAICGFINFQRWGSPLTFQDYRYYNSAAPDDPVFNVIRDYGYFNLQRIPFGLSYFFVPIWAVIDSGGHFLFRAFQDRVLYIVELPPATFLASDLFLCFTAMLGVAWLARARSIAIDRFAACLVVVSLMLPGLLMLMAMALTFRYRMEFYPGFDFLALFGLLALADKFAARPRRWSIVCGLMVGISILSAHAFLLAYKIGPWGDSERVQRTGWASAYRAFFHDKYPGIGDRFGVR